ncbi:MAG: energy transducer TonB [Acidobacteria bacterium]|nr:energy transducer TonB [Acidobacteriota bacterium]
MVEAQKVEQRGQAVKRFRSLFDMHSIAFGSPENLGGVLLGLHEDRHFAMDFWSLVNALSSQESDAPSEAELLETVIESATGTSSVTLPKDEQPGVHELRQMLGGIDTARPAELPDAINRPNDALLQPLPPPAVAAPASTSDSGARAVHATRRSIGDALAKLEQTSRELREQLAELDEHAAQEELPFAAAPAVEARLAETKVDELKPVVTKPVEPVAEREASSARRAFEAPPVQTPVPVAAVPEVVERIEAPRATPVEQVSAPAAPVPLQESVPVTPPVVPPSPPVETEVFAPRPVRELSHRGLAQPGPGDDPDDDPSIVAPLSGYAAQQGGGSGARVAVAAIVIAAVAAGGFYGSRTEAGHGLLTSAGAKLRATYLKAKDALGKATSSSAPEATPSPQQSAADTAPATPPPAAPAPATTPEADTSAEASDKSAQTPPPAQEDAAAAEPPATAAAKPAIKTPKPVIVPAPVHKAKVEPVVKKHPDEAAAAAATAARALERQHAEEAASASLERVPGAIMARNLLASRVPAYPEAARSQQIEGPVELQVVVTPSGAVKSAHAVSGDRHLRAAAEEAVSKWRYRPYIENGSAVEIVTTVRVDFRLPQ